VLGQEFKGITNRWILHDLSSFGCSAILEHLAAVRGCFQEVFLASLPLQIVRTSPDNGAY
jgi:hypothetical protein